MKPSARSTYAVLALCVLVLGFLSRGHHYYEWDAAQYALGTIDYRISNHQPHPPGYPVWVLMLKIGKLFTRDVNLVATLLGEAFTLVALIALYALGRRLMDDAVALLAAVALATCSVVTLYMRVGTIYPPDLASSAVLGYWSYLCYRRQLRPGFGLGLVMAFFLGVRQSGCAFMLPLVALASLRAVDWRPWRVWRTAVALSIGVAAWLVPAAALSGGVANFLAMARHQSHLAFAYSSIFLDAPATIHLSHLKLGLISLLLSLGALALASMASAAIFRRPASWRPAFEMLPFWLAWLLPNLVVTFGFHLPKPGYLMLSLPPLFLLGCQFIANAVGEGRRDLARWIVGGVAVANLLVGPLVESQQKGRPYIENLWLHAIPLSVQIADASVDTYTGILAGISSDPARVLVFPTVPAEGLNHRALITEFPKHNIAALVSRTTMVVDNGLNRRTIEKVPREVETLLWVAPAGDNWGERTTGLSRVRRVFADRYLSFWVADLPPFPNHATVRQGGDEYWLEREPPLERS
jgi:hypothetical protein